MAENPFDNFLSRLRGNKDNLQTLAHAQASEMVRLFANAKDQAVKKSIYPTGGATFDLQKQPRITIFRVEYDLAEARGEKYEWCVSVNDNNNPVLFHIQGKDEGETQKHLRPKSFELNRIPLTNPEFEIKDAMVVIANMPNETTDGDNWVARVRKLDIMRAGVSEKEEVRIHKGTTSGPVLQGTS